MPEMMMVMFWEYSDKSGYGIVRIYPRSEQARAERDLELLNQHANVTYGLAWVPVEDRK